MNVHSLLAERVGWVSSLDSVDAGEHDRFRGFHSALERTLQSRESEVMLLLTDEYVPMAHGAGGSATDSLIKKYMLKYLEGSSAEAPLGAFDNVPTMCTCDGSWQVSSVSSTGILGQSSLEYSD
jgi:hypothetical protein